MKIALDIDGVITQYPEFFRMLSHSLKNIATIYIITNRDPDTLEEIEEELYRLDIPHNHIIITADKAKFILDEGITVLFEDTDEYFLSLPPSVCVCKVREPGNFNYATQKWVYGPKTGENINQR